MACRALQLSVRLKLSTKRLKTGVRAAISVAQFNFSGKAHHGKFSACLFAYKSGRYDLPIALGILALR